MAAVRRGTVLLTCLTCSRQNKKLPGVVSRYLSRYIAITDKKFLRKTQHVAAGARSMCESFSALNISDQDEELEIPKAADSHLTPSIFDNEHVNKFVNCMMWDGKKSVSQSILKKALEDVKAEQLKKQRVSADPESIQTDPLKVFLEAVDNCKPVVGVMAMRRAGSVFQNNCCGVINYADWRNTTYGGRRYDKVPDSCCKVQDHACGFEFELTKINHGGCLKPVKGSTVRHLLIVGVGGLVVFLIEIALAIATFIIRKKNF